MVRSARQVALWAKKILHMNDVFAVALCQIRPWSRSVKVRLMKQSEHTLIVIGLGNSCSSWLNLIGCFESVYCVVFHFNLVAFVLWQTLFGLKGPSMCK